jgi:multidrug efflux pump subunit AcrB
VRNRFRLITMITLSAILMLMPLALGAGLGMQQPLAIAVISGLLVQVPLVLLAMSRSDPGRAQKSTRGANGFAR